MLASECARLFRRHPPAWTSDIANPFSELSRPRISLTSFTDLNALCSPSLPLNCILRLCAHTFYDILLQRVTSFNPVNVEGDTPLHLCAQNGHSVLGDRLLRISGINVNIQNRNDETALFIAAQLDHLGLVQSLIAAGASPHLPDLSGVTAIDASGSQEVLAELQEYVRALKTNSASASASRTIALKKQRSMGTLPGTLWKSKSHGSSANNIQSSSPPLASPQIPTRVSQVTYHDSISLSSSVPSGLGVTRERSGSAAFAQQARHRLMLMDEELHHSGSYGAFGSSASSTNDAHASDGSFGPITAASVPMPHGLHHGDSSTSSMSFGGGTNASGPSSAQDSNDSDRELETVPEDVSSQVDRLSDELSEELNHLFEDSFILDAVSKITSAKSFRWRRTYSRTKIEVLKWLADYVGEEDEAHQAFLRHLKSKYPEAIKLNFVRTPSAKRLNKKEKSQKKLTMVERRIKSYDWELLAENLMIQENVGTGSYGSVHRAMLAGMDGAVAVKLLASDVSEDDAVTFMKEIAILSRLSHPSIVGFVGATITGTLSLVMEYCSQGNLKQFLQQKQSTSWTTKLRLAREAAEGIAYLHAQFPPIVHRDLKCQNLLVHQSGAVKVSDFGLSKTIVRTIGNASKMGTLNWLAPEVLRGEEIHNTAVDVYAFGMVLYEILMDGKSPYDTWQPLQVVRAIDEGLQPEVPDHCDADFRELLQLCWLRDAQKRPSMHFIVEKLSSLELAALDSLTVALHSTAHYQHLHTRKPSSSSLLLKSSSSSLPPPSASSGSGAFSSLHPMTRIESQPEIGSGNATGGGGGGGGHHHYHHHHHHNNNGNNGNSVLSSSPNALTSTAYYHAPPSSGNGNVGDSSPSATSKQRALHHQHTDSSLTSSVGSTTSTSSPNTTPREERDVTPTNSPRNSPRNSSSPRITPHSASFQLPTSTIVLGSSPSKSSSAIAITAPSSPKMRKKDSKIHFSSHSTSPSEPRSSSLTLKSKPQKA